MHTRFERVKDPTDPQRCQASSQSYGQCPFKALPETKYCPRHGGIQAEKRNEAKGERLYMLAEWATRFGRQADHPKLKSLREEVAVLRMTLEARLNKCKDEEELAMRAGGVVELVRELAKTVRTCHALEMSMGTVLDKPQAEAWVTEIGAILANYIEDPAILQMIAEDIIASLESKLNAQPQQPLLEQAV